MTTRTISFEPSLGPAESYVRSSSISTEVVQGRYLHPESIGQKMNMERITFQTFNGDPGVWLFDVLHGTAVIESPDTKYGGIKAYQKLSLKVRVSFSVVCSTITDVIIDGTSGQDTYTSQSGSRRHYSLTTGVIADIILVLRSLKLLQS